MGVQLAVAEITAVYAVVASAVTLLVVKLIVGLLVNEEIEARGLDLGEHGERGYIH